MRFAKLVWATSLLVGGCGNGATEGTGDGATGTTSGQGSTGFDATTAASGSSTSTSDGGSTGSTSSTSSTGSGADSTSSGGCVLGTEGCACGDAGCEEGLWCNGDTCAAELAPQSIIVRIENPGELAALAHVPLDLDPKTFDYAAASPTGDDLRFSSDGLTADIPYFIETWSPEGVSRVWMRVESLAAGNTDVELHFGDPQLPPGSNGADTFLFFDDFDGDDLDPMLWVVDGEFTALDVQNGVLSLEAASNVPGESLDVLHSAVGFGEPFSTHVRYGCGFDCTEAGFLFSCAAADTQLVFLDPPNPAVNLGSARFTGPGSGSYVSTIYPDVTRPEELTSFEVDASLGAPGPHMFLDRFCNLGTGECDGAYPGGIQMASTGDDLTELQVGFGAWSTNDSLTVDRIFVRAALDPAPFAYVLQP